LSTTIDLPTQESLKREQHAVRAQLAWLRNRLRLQLILEFAADLAAVLAVTAAVLVFLDWWFRFGLPVRILLLVLSLAGVFGFLVVRALRRWRSSRLDELSLAMTLDRHRPGTGQQIADVLQLPDLLSESSTLSAAASPAMVKLAVQRAAKALASSDWRSLWNRKRTALYAGIFFVGLLIPSIFGVVAPQAARLSLARWLQGSNERWPQHTYLTVMGIDEHGRLLAPRDERVVVEVRSDLPMVEPRAGRWLVHGRGEPMSLWWNPEHPRRPEAVLVRERTAEGATRPGVMVETEPGLYRFEFPPSAANSTFELTGGDDWLGPLELERVDRPFLADTRLRVKEPGATYTGFRTVEDAKQHLLFLPDTEIEMTLVGNEALSETQVKIQAGKGLGLKRSDERTFTSALTLHEATTLEILLTSGKSGLVSQPAFISIGILKDRAPRVTLRAMGIGSHVTPIATIPLSIGATDDFGLAAMRLLVDRSVPAEDKGEPKSERSSVGLTVPQEKDRPALDHQARHEMLLQADPPKIGTVIRLVAEADDKCARGVQTGRSSALAFQVVSADELFYEILIRQRAERAKFLAVLESLEKQTPVLAGQPKADDFLKVMRVEHTGARQLDQIAGRVADTLQEMKLNQVGSPKSHRLLQEGVIDPTRALAAGPMNQLRGVLQALSGAATGAQASEEEARRLHTEVVTTMKKILEQMSQWESFVDVVNQVAEVIKMEQKVLQATEKARETRTQGVFDDKP
jgi:hypothetical protein